MIRPLTDTVYRQCANLAEDYGLDLSRATLTQAVLAAGELLRAVVSAQAAEIKRGSYHNLITPHGDRRRQFIVHRNFIPPTKVALGMGARNALRLREFAGDKRKDE